MARINITKRQAMTLLTILECQATDLIGDVNDPFGPAVDYKWSMKRLEDVGALYTKLHKNFNWLLEWDIEKSAEEAAEESPSRHFDEYGVTPEGWVG